MKESHREEVAHHTDPESCAGRRKAAGEGLTGAHADPALSCEIKSSGTPTPLREAEGNMGRGVKREPRSSPTQSETRSTRGNSSPRNWEVPRVPVADSETGRLGKAVGRTSSMHARGKSDEPIVPRKLPNKDGGNPSAEAAEGRGSTKGNTRQSAAPRTQSRTRASYGLASVREAARKDKRMRFTALLHHVTVYRLRESFYALKRQAAPGVDGITWQEYEARLEERLTDLHARVQRGAYRAMPSKRAYIPKADGRMRPLGIAALEDKIVQHAVVTVLNAVYEADFLGFSYGFRPGRSQHDALDALWVGLTEKKVNWVLDADIRGFFDTISHEWLMKFVAHRIADRRILRLIRKWLKAGVLENGIWSGTEVGTPQGAVISPLLANIYLHYVLDLWANQWRSRHAQGDVIIARYADDFVLGFQHPREAERFLQALKERMEQFGLALHPDKTRLIEFGRFAACNRKQRGERKPETFDFLGFTHLCGVKYLTPGFLVKRKTIAKRLRAKIQEVKQTLMRQRHASVPEQGAWLRKVAQGYYNYHAIPGNMPALETFHRETVRVWRLALRRRSQRHRMNWKRFHKLEERWIPQPKILHPYPNVRFYAKHPR